MEQRRRAKTHHSSSEQIEEHPNCCNLHRGCNERIGKKYEKTKYAVLGNDQWTFVQLQCMLLTNIKIKTAIPVSPDSDDLEDWLPIAFCLATRVIITPSTIRRQTQAYAGLICDFASKI